MVNLVVVDVISFLFCSFFFILMIRVFLDGFVGMVFCIFFVGFNVFFIVIVVLVFMFIILVIECYNVIVRFLWML